MASRRRFSDEYKREAVRLATQSGVTKSQIGRELGIHANLLGRWCRDHAAHGAAAFPGQGKPRDESPPGPPARAAGRLDGVVATDGLKPGGSSLGPRLPGRIQVIVATLGCSRDRR